MQFAMTATAQSRTVPLPTEWRDFFALTKPRVMSLVVFTGLCGLIAAPGYIHPVIGFSAVLCIALGVAPAKQVFSYFADPIVFLFIGSFMLARAMAVHGLDRRIALSFLSIPAVSCDASG